MNSPWSALKTDEKKTTTYPKSPEIDGIQNTFPHGWFIAEPAVPCLWPHPLPAWRPVASPYPKLQRWPRWKAWTPSWVSIIHQPEYCGHERGSFTLPSPSSMGFGRDVRALSFTQITMERSTTFNGYIWVNPLSVTFFTIAICYTK